MNCVWNTIISQCYCMTMYAAILYLTISFIDLNSILVLYYLLYSVEYDVKYCCNLLSHELITSETNVSNGFLPKKIYTTYYCWEKIFGIIIVLILNYALMLPVAI